MQENPDGNYYLAKDITIKGNLNLFPNYYDYDTKAVSYTHLDVYKRQRIFSRKAGRCSFWH